MSTQESRVLALELDPTPSRKNKGCFADQQGVWDRNVSCLYPQNCSSPGLGFCTLGIVKNINVLADCLCRPTLVSEVPPRTQEKV